MNPPEKNRHIMGITRDICTGIALKGLKVEALDMRNNVNLGVSSTNEEGEFNIWFNQPQSAPESHVQLRVLQQGKKIHETQTDKNFPDSNHKCSKQGCVGKNYELHVEYVWAEINKVGVISTSKINPQTGLADTPTDTGIVIKGRPFGGGWIELSGRIWGHRVNRWQLWYGQNIITPTDDSIKDLISGKKHPFTLIAEGNEPPLIWNTKFPIDDVESCWGIANLNGKYTVILIVWDDKGNTFIDTQAVCINNEPIVPGASISSPADGETITAYGGKLKITGTACCQYPYFYRVYWSGPTQENWTLDKITYPGGKSSEDQKEVTNDGPLCVWDVSGLNDGPYSLALEVWGKTIMSSGGMERSDLVRNFNLHISP